MIKLKGWQFATPVQVVSPEECYFYHTMDVPYLRGRYGDYLYGADVSGKSVLDVGTANGWISFEVEHHGGGSHWP